MERRMPETKTEGTGPRRQWLDKAGIAAHIGVSPRTVTNLMRRRVLCYVKVGRLVRFDPEACDKALKAFEIKSIVLGEN